MKGAILVSHAVEARLAGELERVAPGVPRVVFHPAAGGGADAVAGDLGSVEVVYFSGDLFQGGRNTLLPSGNAPLGLCSQSSVIDFHRMLPQTCGKSQIENALRKKFIVSRISIP